VRILFREVKSSVGPATVKWGPQRVAIVCMRTSERTGSVSACRARYIKNCAKHTRLALGRWTRPTTAGWSRPPEGARTGRLRPAIPIDCDQPLRLIATTCYGRSRQPVDGGDGRRWVIRESAWASLLFHGERGNAWTEITHAQDLRRAEAIRGRHVETHDRHSTPPPVD
jgi:hypothetical protein